MTIKNLTPHDIKIVGENGEITTFPKSGQIARVASKKEVVRTLEGFEVFAETFGEVEGLPAEETGVFLIVSRLVAAACPTRRDLLVPGELVRDENGQPVAAKGFATLCKEGK